jgi:uncharacterized protein YdaT
VFVGNAERDDQKNGEITIPWSAKSFASKHNKKLKGAAASKAASMASAMVREGVPEGTAIATANKHGNKLMRMRKRGAISSRVAEKHGYDGSD